MSYIPPLSSVSPHQKENVSLTTRLRDFETPTPAHFACPTQGNPHSFSPLSHPKLLGGGKSEEELAHYQSLLKRLEEEHDAPASANCCLKIGQCFNQLDRREEALASFKKALAIYLDFYTQTGNAGHPDIAMCYSDIGDCQKSLGRHSEALISFENLLAIYLKLYGPNHLNVAICYINIGNSQNKLGRYQEALDSCQKAIEAFSRFPNFDPSASEVCFAVMGDSRYNLRLYQEALASYYKALSIYTLSTLLVSPARPHPNIATYYINIGNCQENLKSHLEALDSFQNALAVYLPLYGSDHPGVATCYTNIGICQKSLDLPEAFDSFSRALQIRLQLYEGPNHPDVGLSHKCLGVYFEDVGDNEKAKSHYGEALAIYQRFLGEEDPKTLACQQDMERVFKDV